MYAVVYGGNAPGAELKFKRALRKSVTRGSHTRAASRKINHLAKPHFQHLSSNPRCSDRPCSRHNLHCQSFEKRIVRIYYTILHTTQISIFSRECHVAERRSIAVDIDMCGVPAGRPTIIVPMQTAERRRHVSRTNPVGNNHQGSSPNLHIPYRNRSSICC